MHNSELIKKGKSIERLHIDAESESVIPFFAASQILGQGLSVPTLRCDNVLPGEDTVVHSGNDRRAWDNCAMTNWGARRNADINLRQCHFINQRSHITSPGVLHHFKLTDFACSTRDHLKPDTVPSGCPTPIYWGCGRQAVSNQKAGCSNGHVNTRLLSSGATCSTMMIILLQATSRWPDTSKFPSHINL